MLRVVVALVMLTGCDQLFNIEHVTLSDGGPSDGRADGGDAFVAASHYVQGNSRTSSSGVSIQVTLPNAQAAGDLLVVIIGWTGTAAISSVGDTRGDTFQLAGGIAAGNNLGQVMYYSQNIAVGATNAVTVMFGATTTDIDVRVLEYTKMAKTGAFQGGINAADTGSTKMSTPLFVVPANSVLVAGFMSNAQTTEPGAGFTERIKTTVGNYAEDRNITTLGNYAGEATQSNTGAYIANAAAFLAQ